MNNSNNGDDEDNTDDAICKVRAPMLNDTGVSIQPATRMDKNGEPINDNNAPRDVSISIDTNKQATLPLKNEIPTSLMDLEDNQHHPYIINGSGR